MRQFLHHLLHLVLAINSHKRFPLFSSIMFTAARFCLSLGSLSAAHKSWYECTFCNFQKYYCPVHHLVTLTDCNFSEILWNNNVFYLFSECQVPCSLQTVMRQCHGKRRCTVPATQSVFDVGRFNNVCPPNIQKYLSVVYACGKSMMKKKWLCLLEVNWDSDL